MHSGSALSPTLLAAKEHLTEERQKLKEQHDRGSPAVQVCAHLTDLIDTIILDLYQAALAEIGEHDHDGLPSEIALVPHGGYGRRDLAPYSDVDLMLLHHASASQRVVPLARRLSQNIYDLGLQLGFSVRSPRQACRMALKDPVIFTSLVESRFLAGSVGLFSKYMARFRSDAARRSRSLIHAIDQARREERIKYGDTVYLLKPNIKRSRGGLRDIQLIRWTGFARFGHCEPRNLYQAGVLSLDDRTRLREAREFLLRLRNELHFHAGRAEDVLERVEQVRLAELYGYQGAQGMLPVEQFMRSYFENTSEVRYIMAHFMASAKSPSGLARFFGPLLSHQVEGDFRVGPLHIQATRQGLEKVRGDLAQVLRLMDLANLYNRRIGHDTWQAIRQSMSNHTAIELSADAIRRFLSLMSQPAQLGEMLRRLHQLRVLEKIIPAVKHARCLLQFNEYHKYTVDEHSIRAVELATEFINDPGPLGDAYRGIKQKRILHLALLLHDLGKGFPEDHCEVGLQLARQTTQHLHLPQREAEIVQFLVHKHLLMSHLALWRDIDDESVVLQFAVEIGSPDVLKMLYVMTCADLAAVGPGVLNQWKKNLLADLYRRAMQHLAGEGAAMSSVQWLKTKRDDVRKLIESSSDAHWWNELIDQLPASYLQGNSPKEIVDELQVLRTLPSDDARAWGRFVPDRNAVQYTIVTHESITAGVFYKLTGALTSKGQQILAAEINTLPGSLVLDRFYVLDLDFASPPPAERMAEVSCGLTAALKDKAENPPTFRRVWQSTDGDQSPEIRHLPTRVHIDNDSSENFTIVDVFAHDRIGLLYSITRTLFQLGLSVSIAKIGTYLDQVVDVFYVTDQQGHKVQNENRFAEIRQRLLEAIDATAPQQQEMKQA